MQVHVTVIVDYRYLAKPTVMMVFPKSLLGLLKNQAEKNGDKEGLSCVEFLSKTSSIEFRLDG